MRLTAAALAIAALYVACAPATTSQTATAGPPQGDADGDGYDGNVDCDDAEPAVHPDAREITCDGVDNDCRDGDARADCTLTAAEADLTFPLNLERPSVMGWTIAGDLDGLPGDDAIDLMQSRTPDFTLYSGIATGKTTFVAVPGLPAMTAGDATGDGRDDLWVRSGDTAYLLAGPLAPGIDLDRDAVASLTGMETYDTFEGFGHEDVDGDGLADLVDPVGLSCAGKLVGPHAAEDVCVRYPNFDHGGQDPGYGPSGPTMNGDLTGDGVPDLVVSSSAGWAIRSSNGDGWQTDASVTVGSSHPVLAATTGGDLDGDGYADLGLTLDEPRGLVLAHGPFGVGYTDLDKEAYARVDDLYLAFVLGDLDDDGAAELTGVTEETIYQRVIRAPSSGVWTADEVSVSTTDAYFIRQFRPAPDVDGDGLVDVVARGGPNQVFTTLAEFRP